MQDMSTEEFARMKEESARKMKELYKESHMPPFPDFVTINNKREEKVTDNYKNEPPSKSISTTKFSPVFNPSNTFRFINFPELLKSPDSLLILGLIFLLLSDNADEKLILALIFIML